MLGALSHVPALKSIVINEWRVNGRTEDTENIQAAVLASNSSQFRELRHLTLQSRIPDITAFLSKLHCLKILVRLRLDVISASPGDDLSALLQKLSSSRKI